MNEIETTTMEMEDVIQLALIAVEAGVTVDWLTQRFRGEVLFDDIGMRAVPTSAAREFFAERAERQRRHVEQDRRRREEESAKPRVQVVGVPAIEGMDPFESMKVQDPAYSTPSQDFGTSRGNPHQEFMDDMFAESNRAAAARREKARLAKEKRKEPK